MVDVNLQFCTRELEHCKWGLEIGDPVLNDNECSFLNDIWEMTIRKLNKENLD